MAKNNLSHDPIVIANAAAATVAVVFVVCRLAFLLAPELSLAISKTWFHGIDISKIAATSAAADPGSFILGLVTSIAAAWAVGYLFANLYNYFVKK